MSDHPQCMHEQTWTCTETEFVFSDLCYYNYNTEAFLVSTNVEKNHTLIIFLSKYCIMNVTMKIAH